MAAIRCPALVHVGVVPAIVVGGGANALEHGVADSDRFRCGDGDAEEGSACSRGCYAVRLMILTVIIKAHNDENEDNMNILALVTDIKSLGGQC